MKKAARILIVEDNSTDAELAEHAIHKVLKDCTFDLVETRKDFLEALESFQPDVILADYALPRFDGLTALKLARKHAPFTPTIIWTGASSEDIAVDCMKAGANNYVLKENVKRLGPAVIRALEERELLLAHKQAEEKYQTIFENSVVGIFQSTPQGRYRHVNAAMARIYGYASPDEMIKAVKNITQQIYVDASQRTEFVRRLDSQNTIEHYEARNYRKDHSIIWTSTSARAVRDSEGNILYYEGFITDISARKEIEEELKERQRQLTILFGNLPGPVYRCRNDANYTMDFISEGIQELSGYPAEDFQQHRRDYGKLIHAEDQEQVWTEIQAAVGQRQPFELTYRILTASGQQKWVWEKGQGVYDATGQLQALEGFITDITARKHAEEVIQDREKHFRALIENGLDNISLLAEDGTLLWESPATTRTLDYAPDKFVGRNIFELMHPDDFEWTRELYTKLLQEPGSRQSGVFRLRHSSGTWRWVEAIVTNMLNEPSVNALVVNYRDVTERRLTEEALLESQLKYQNLVETSHDLIWSIDAEGRFTFVNGAAKQVYGYEPEELLGRSFFDLLDPEYYQLADLDHFRELLTPLNEFREFETHVQHRDGRKLVLSANSIVIRDQEDRIVGVTGSSRDITLRKRVEEVLKEERNLLRTLIDNLPDRIYAMDIDGRKTLSNTADWRACGGKSVEDVIGKTDFDTYPPDMAEEFWQLDRAVLESGQPVINYEEPGLDAKGNRLSILTTKIPLRDSDGNVVGLVGIGRDITERKLVEEHISDLFAFNEKILNHSAVGILTYKVSGECVFANEKAASIVGTSVTQLLAQNFRTIEAWKRSGLYDLAEKALSTQAPASADIHHLSTFGKDVWMTVHCVAFKSKGEQHVLLSISDITERKRAEEALRESENRLVIALSGAQMSVWEWNLKTNQILWSPEFFRITGLDEDEFAGTFESFTDLIHSDDVARVQNAAEKAVQEQTLFAEEFRIICPDGEIRWLSNLGRAEYDSTGSHLRLIGTVQDVTQRKQAEIERQALLEIMQGLANTEDLNELMKLIHHAIAQVIDTKNFFIVLYQPNTGFFEEIYSVDQYDLPEPPGKLENSITSYVFRSGEPLLLTQALFDELVKQGEMKLVGTNSASWLGVPLKTSGKTIGVMAVQDYEIDNRYTERDKHFLASIAAQVALVIERKRAEEALRESEEHYRAIFEGVQDAIFVESLDGKILTVNQQACEMFGYSYEEFLTKTVKDLVPQGNLILRADAGNSLLTAEPHETFNRRANGEIFPIDISGRLQVINGQKVLLVVVRDITERKKAEKLLQESEDRFSSAFEFASIGMALVSPDGHWLRVNRALCQLVGYSEGELVQKTFQDITYHADLETDVSYVQQVLGGEIDSYEMEKRYIHKSGKIIWVLLSASLVRDHEGRPLYFISQIQDITERKEAEDALHKSEALYRQAIEIAGAVPYYETYYDEGQAIKYEFIGEGIRQITGYSPQEFNAALWDSLVEEINLVGDLAGYSLEEAIQRVRAGENSIWKCEHRLRDRTGNIHWVFEAAVELRDEDGISYGSIGTYQDITERKLAEEALREAETKYRTLVEQLPSVTYLDVIDEPLASGEFNTSYISPQVENLLGYPPHAFQTDHGLWTKLIHPDDRERVLARIAEYYQNQGFYSDEYRMWTRKGIEIWVRDEAIMVRGNGNKIPFSQGVIFDITERKRMESAEREQRALAEALRDTAEILSSTLDYGEVLDHILTTVGRVVPHDAATIMLIEGEFARVVRSRGYNQRGFNVELIGVTLPLAETSNLQQMFTTGQPEVVPDTWTYAGWKNLWYADWLRSNVGAPISIYGAVIGFILLDSGTPGFFTAVHTERLEAFANQAALAIHNARLLQQAQEEISERKRAEEALRLEKERLESIAATVPGIICSFRLLADGSACMPFASLAIQDVYGFRPADLQEDIAPLFARMHPDDLHHVNASIQESAVTLLPWHAEFRYNHPTKGEVWIEGQSMPLREEDGSTIWHGFIHDVTERKRAEEELRASEERFRQLADNIQEIFWMTDAETGREIYISPAAEAIWGQPLETFVHEPNTWTNGVFPDDRPQVLQNIEKEKSGEKVEMEYRIVRPDGALRWVWDRAFPIFDGAGKVKKIAGITADITERKQAEEEIRRRAEENSILLKASLALTNLDLKTTLQTVGDSAKNLFAADGCRIFLMEPDGKALRCVLALQESLTAFSDLRIKIGEGVTGAVAASGLGEIVNEMQNDPRSVHVTGTPEEEEAIMFAPLKERDNTIGVLSVRRTGKDRPFQPADLILLEALASMAASAVSNARLFAETQRRLSELEALYENGLAVGRLLKPNQIGNRLINTFSRYLPWHHVTIRLRRDASDELELVAFSLPNLQEEERANVEQHFVARINRVGQGLSGWVIQTGVPLRTGNVQTHPQYIDTHAGIQSGLYMPLKVGERVIGVISVESEAPDAFTEQDERLLATLASQAAIAFENARLYQKIEQELSERKRAQEALLISETHYRELADSITDILFELDRDLRYTHWNKASEMFSGISAEHAIGRSMMELFGTSREQSGREEIYRSVLREQRARTFETEVIAKGQKRSLEINAYPSARGVSVVAKDVTDRKRTEIIMQKRFELMEYSAHHSLDELMQRTVDEVSKLTDSTIGFFHFVQEDQNTLGAQTWSSSALELFEVPLSEGTHLPLDQAGVWADAVHQRRPLIQNDYEALPHKKGLPQGHVPIRREIVIPIIRNEKVMAIMGIGNKAHEYTSYDLEVAERLADYAWDITERKQMQVALEVERNQLAKRVEERTSALSQANSNLARALRVKDEFLANMSHELRTPLNAILGLSESLGEQIAGPLNEKQQKYITTISESGHHLLSLINDILDLAKIEAGQITLDINKVDVQQVCQASLRMIKQLAQKKNQDVVLKTGQEVGLMWADERRLKQMIVNLLGNAVKFTPENGQIGLEVHGDQAANKVTITVWDNGIGIRENDLARLFQPFVQLDSGLAREATGTGLGLALVAQMARLHGGSVSAVSEPGQGSRFSIILPWEPALAMDTTSRLRTTGKFRAIKPDEANRPTILLVEDTKEVVMMIQDYLELAGYKVVTARDGVEAIAQARLIHPDLILMDVMMPRLDGFEATRKLRSEPEFKYTPIVALTALAMPSDRERCLAAGMDEYISKPINLKALVRLIQSCLFGNEETKRK